MNAQGRAEDRVTLLRCLLDALVPMRMTELAGRLDTAPPLQDCLDLIAHQGDDLEHGGPNGRKVLGAVTTALAVIALTRPEGVDLFGGHWCPDHDTCGSPT